MARYRAQPGQEDRDGEMTGAISVNMVLSMPWVTAWCVFLGPWVFRSLAPTVLVGVALAVLLPIAFMPVSRRIWAAISDFMDGAPPG